jgi:hypothetical protein
MRSLYKLAVYEVLCLFFLALEDEAAYLVEVIDR